MPWIAAYVLVVAVGGVLDMMISVAFSCFVSLSILWQWDCQCMKLFQVICNCWIWLQWSSRLHRETWAGVRHWTVQGRSGFKCLADSKAGRGWSSQIPPELGILWGTLVWLQLWASAIHPFISHAYILWMRHSVMSSWEVRSHVIDLQSNGPASKLSLKNKLREEGDSEDNRFLSPEQSQQHVTISWAAANTLKRFKRKHCPHKGQSHASKQCLRNLIKPKLSELFYAHWTTGGSHLFPGVA